MSSSPSGLTFVDASGWIALVNRNDGLHRQAARLLQQRLDEQVARRCAPSLLLYRLFKRKCQSPPGLAHMNPQGIGERPQRSAAG